MSGISRKKIRYGSGERGGQFHRRDMSGRKHFHTRTNDAFLNLSAMTWKRGRDILVVSDEVYEHVLYDGRKHASVMMQPELAAKSFTVFSFGKTLHATGWRTGYCVAPPALTRELRKVHQFNTFSIVSPLQYAIARYLAAYPDAWQGLAAFFEAKRDLLAGLLRGSGLEPLPAAGAVPVGGAGAVPDTGSWSAGAVSAVRVG